MLLAPGFLGWLAILHTGGPVKSEPISLLGPIAFDPMWALVAGTGMALAYGATGLSKPRLVDCLSPVLFVLVQPGCPLGDPVEHRKQRVEVVVRR